MKPSDARATATGVTNEEKSNDTDDSHPENKSSQRKRAREETPEGDRDNAETAKNPAIDAAHAPKITSDGMVEFSLAAIHKHLVCGLCSGYLKDPYKITECLHTYCKSCLFYSIACGCHECPKCNVYLGTDPTRIAVLDHSMQDLLDNIIFPGVLEKEKQSEVEFYAQRGIEMKPEFAEKEKKKEEGPPTRSRNTSTYNSKKDELEFTLMPEVTTTGNDLPPIDCPSLHTSGKFRMNQLKKYLIQKLGLSSASQLALDILCNGVPLGDELSLGFVKRLLWHHESDLALTYRVTSDLN